ncbi:lipoprotein signal peptidase [Desulfuromonas soudanensis]|uniref:Lipoprotein signal peptidase n=1 Tax=Desulfuromonas soudanensis TaxID=1603606 RepID=A0A0M5IQZ3_9BACT|nr:signal peptidase II [Desulfuromonas soudanensis]ALC15274.1 lipoprotein signal peptidase [Desulfuromonas soudanensis]
MNPGAAVSRYKLLGLVSAVILVVDQATKLYIDSRFLLHESVQVVENFFHITYVRNKGAAFGILSDSPLRIPFFITVALVAALGILWYLSRTRADQRLLHFALALVFSGAVGNLIDRIRLGEVIDFLDVHWYRHHWPAFNVADSAITVGVALMLLDMWQEERKSKNEQKESK